MEPTLFWSRPPSPVNVVGLGADSVHRLPRWPDARHSTSRYNSFVDREYFLIVIFFMVLLATAL